MTDIHTTLRNKAIRQRVTELASAKSALVEALAVAYPPNSKVSWERSGRVHHGYVVWAAAWGDRMQVLNQKTQKKVIISSFEILRAEAASHD